jgi:DNA-binding SARP family transcriptional activator
MASKAQPAPARLALLGRFAVTLRSEEQTLATDCQRLVGFLGIRGPLPIARSRAAAILWPAVDRERAANRLRTCLYRLGDAADLFVERTDQTLRLALDTVVDYQQAVDRGRDLCDPRSAVAIDPGKDTSLFQYELLPGWDEEWVVVERESFRQLRFAALEAIAARSIDLGHYEAAIQACLLVTRAEPLRESAHRLIARAHAGVGNYAEALRQLSQYAELLWQELGVRPSTLVVDLRRELNAIDR